MSAHESILGYEYLYSVLSGDATLAGYAPGGVWRALAPPATSTPFVIIAFHTGIDSTTMNGYRMLVDSMFQVKAVGPASNTDAIANAAEQIDILLGGTTSGPSSGTVTRNGVAIGKVTCYRQSPLAIDELVNGELWSNIGGLYRLIIEQIN